jgi:hypothetical protein
MKSIPQYTEPANVLSQNVRLGLSECQRTSFQRSSFTLVTEQSQKHDVPLICQTPWLCLSCPPRFITKQGRRIYFFTLRFWELEDSFEQCQWLKFLRALQITFREWAKRKAKRAIQRPVEWVSFLEEPTYSYYTFHDYNGSKKTPVSSELHSTYWKFNTRLDASVGCYDSAGVPKNIQDVIQWKQGTFVRFIIHFANVWIHEDTQLSGLTFRILQLQNNEVSPPRTYAFQERISQTSCASQTDAPQGTTIESVDPTVSQHRPASKCTDGSTSTKRTQHPVYGTYFRMCAKGVPKPAVQHKMRMNGLNPDILDLPSNEPLPEVQNSDRKANSVDVLALSLQDGQQLRKTDINIERKLSHDMSSGTGHGFSLGEIVNGLKSLRKTFGFTKASTSSTTNNEVDAAGTTKLSTNNSTGQSDQDSSFLNLLAKRYSL